MVALLVHHDGDYISLLVIYRDVDYISQYYYVVILVIYYDFISR